MVRREDMDGIKVYLGKLPGWVMVRASGTEPMLSETNRAETTRRVLDEVSALVRKL